MKLPDERNISQAVRRLNPDLFVAGLHRAESQPIARPALEQAEAPSAPSARRLASRTGPKWVVCITSYRTRALDSDNMIAGLKPLRDSIAATLGCDDNDREVEWTYSQVITRHPQGVAVIIRQLDAPGASRARLRERGARARHQDKPQ